MPEVGTPLFINILVSIFKSKVFILKDLDQQNVCLSIFVLVLSRGFGIMMSASLDCVAFGGLLEEGGGILMGWERISAVGKTRRQHSA